VVADQHESGERNIQLGLFDFIDSVYRQALLITAMCCDQGIGEIKQWLSLPEKSFLIYFGFHVPEDGKEFLREKFSEEPKVSDIPSKWQFATITQHFYQIFGLGDVPEWVESSTPKNVELLNVVALVNRPIRWALIDPQQREAHVVGMQAAQHALESGALELLESGQHGEVGQLILREMTRANRRMQSGLRSDTLTLP
jgi:hypothetical protein